MRLCVIETCYRKHCAHGYCMKHYMQNRRTGNPSARTPKPKQIPLSSEDRFWMKVNKAFCWEWTGCCIPSGYGRVSRASGHHYAHRYAYEITHKLKLRKDQHIHHVCSNRKCVNPDHLLLVPAEQHLKMARSKRGA